MCIVYRRPSAVSCFFSIFSSAPSLLCRSLGDPGLGTARYVIDHAKWLRQDDHGNQIRSSRRSFCALGGRTSPSARLAKGVYQSTSPAPSFVAHRLICTPVPVCLSGPPRSPRLPRHIGQSIGSLGMHQTPSCLPCLVFWYFNSGLSRLTGFAVFGIQSSVFCIQ